MMNASRTSHSLRLVIFLLRLALGLNFFYLGFSTLFNPALGQQLRERSFSGLYYWLSAPTNVGSFRLFFPWAFLIIGICLLLGLITRSASVAGIALTLASYMPNFSYAAISASQFINDEVLIVICLLILVFANAGTYLGVDKFIHIHFSSQHKSR